MVVRGEGNRGDARQDDTQSRAGDVGNENAVGISEFPATIDDILTGSERDAVIDLAQADTGQPDEQPSGPQIIEIALTDDNLAQLPGGADISQPRQNGANLEFVQPDGSIIVIPGGAIDGLIVYIGDIEIPAETLQALLTANGIETAAGPESGGNGVSAGFTHLGPQSVGEGGLGGSNPLAGTTPGSQTGFAPQQFISGNVPPVVLSAGVARVSEEGFGNADSTGLSDTTDDASVTGQIDTSDIGPLSYAFETPAGTLTSGGVPVVWTASGGTLIGTAGGNTVLVATVDASGAFTVVLSGPLDHATPGVEDQIDMLLPVRVTDSGGAFADTTIALTIEDDAPVVGSAATHGFAPVGEVLGTTTYASGNVDLRVPEYGSGGPSAAQVVSMIEIPDNGTIRDLNLTIDLDHVSSGDLEICLIAPDGTKVFIISNDGGTTDIVGALTFDDEAASKYPEYTSGAEIGPGTWQLREDSLSDFDGLDMTGTWTLEIVDFIGVGGAGAGRLHSWSLEITHENTPQQQVNAVVDEDDLTAVAGRDLADGNDDAAPGDADTATDGSIDTDGDASTVSGRLAISWGADDANAVANGGIAGVPVAGDRAVTFAANIATALTGQGLTSGNEALNYALSDDGTTLVAYIGAETAFADVPGDSLVFRVALSDLGDGSFTFDLIGKLDHPAGGGENGLVIGFGFVATDSDGDHSTGSFSVGVNDDVPVLSGNKATETVNEDDLNNEGLTSGFGPLDIIKGSTGTSPDDGHTDWFDPDAIGDPDTIEGVIGLVLEALTHGSTAKSGSLAGTVRFGADGRAAGGGFVFDKTSGSNTAALEGQNLQSGGTPLEYATISVGGYSLLLGYTSTASDDSIDALFAAVEGFIDGSLALDSLDAVEGALEEIGSLIGSGEFDFTLVFSLFAQAQGHYEFRLFDQLDHDHPDSDGNSLTIDFSSLFSAVDGDGDTIALDPETFTVTVNDDAPKETGGAVSTDEDTALNGNLSSFMQAGADGLATTAFAVDDGPEHGTLVINSETGEYTYTPSADYYGSDSFTFTVTDADGDTSDPITVELNIDPVNDAPVFEPGVELQVDADVEFLVNEKTTGYQYTPAITTLPNGSFVITWYTDDQSQDGDGTAIKARVFNADGTEAVSEFLVNETGTAYNQYEPTVTGLSHGGFALAWVTTDETQDGSGYAIKARVFNADGTEAVGEFLVNEEASSSQHTPAITALSNGGFAVTWVTTDETQDESGSAIKARIFNADGTEAVSEFLVNQETSSNQHMPEITALSNGGFAVTWYTEHQGQDGDGTAIKARIFNADGTEAVGEFLVNEATSSNQLNPAIAALPGGGFVVTWATTDQGQDGDGTAIKARVFNADGTEAVSEFVVNDTGTANAQYNPVVTSLANGGFVIAWFTFDQEQDGSSTAIKARVFNADGTEAFPEFLVNDAWFSAQRLPEITALADGGFVVTWSTYDENQDGSGFAVKARIFHVTDQAIFETDSSTGTHTLDGELAFSDVDPTDIHLVTTTAQGSGYAGTFSATVSDSATGDGAGTVTWTFSVNESEIDHLAEGEVLTQTYAVDLDDGNGGMATELVTLTITGTNDAPEITGNTDLPFVSSGMQWITEAHENVGPDGKGNLEPNYTAHVRVESALHLLPNMALVLSWVGEGISPADAIMYVWDYLDDEYVNGNQLNEAFVRLGVEYARYLKNGGTPLLDVVAKYEVDADESGSPDREQSLHDNLLGNLNAGALNSRFSGDPALLDELKTLVESVDPALLDRETYSGDENSTPTLEDTRAWDAAHGYAPAAAGQFAATDVDEPAGKSLEWAIDDSGAPVTSLTGTYGRFEIDAETGKWTYTIDPELPDTQELGAGETATESFTVTVTDEHGASDTLTVEVEAVGTNDAPEVSLVSSNASYTEGDPATGILASLSISDRDDTVLEGATVSITGNFDTGDQLNFTNQNGIIGSYNAATGILVLTGIATKAQYAAAMESITFSSTSENPSGDTRTISYSVTDGDTVSDVAMATVDVVPVNDAPVAVDDAFDMDEDGALERDAAGGLLSNDSDVDGDTLTALLVSGPANGDLTFNSNGSFTYVPDAHFYGTDSFTYRVSDGNSESDVATVTIEVRPVNDAPRAADIGINATEDQNTSFNLLQYPVVVDEEGDPLSIIAVNGDSYTPGSAIMLPSGAVLTVNADGTFVYDQNGAFNHLNVGESAFERFTYTISDGNGGTDTGLVDFHIKGVNDAPVANDYHLVISEDEVATRTLLLSVSDPDNNSGEMFPVLTSSLPDGATLSGWDFTFDPSGHYQDLAAGETQTVSFSYRVEDEHGAQSDVATFTVTVTGVNDAPDAVADSYVAEEDAALTVTAADGVLGNDGDAEGDSLTVTGVNNDPASVGKQIVLASGALLTLNADGSFVYDPNGKFEDLAHGELGMDSFQYTVSDGNGGTSTATATITIDGASEVSGLRPDLNGTTPGSEISVTYTEGDAPLTLFPDITWEGSGPHQIRSVQIQLWDNTDGNTDENLYWPPSGNFTVAALRVVSSYTPDEIEDLLEAIAYRHVSEDPTEGARRVTFQIVYEDGSWDTWTARVNVVAVNDAPTDVLLDITTVSENRPEGTFVGSLSAVDAEVGDGHVFEIVGDPGPFAIAGTSLVTTQALNYEAGPTSYDLTIRATDPAGESVEKTFTITVVNQNEPPEITSDTALSVNEQQTVAGTVAAADPDAGDVLTYSISGGADAALFTIDGATGALSFVAPPHYDNPADAGGDNVYELRVRVEDSNGSSAEQDVTVSVQNVDFAPTDIGLDRTNVNEDVAPGTAIGSLSTVDADIGDSHVYTLNDPSGKFDIVGTTLILKAGQTLDHETASSYDIEIRSEDPTGQWVTKTFTITVNDVAETPSPLHDTIISAYGTSQFSIPQWALLWNDTDPNGDQLSISAVDVPHLSSFANLYLDGQNVVIQDDDDSTTAEYFTYTVTDGIHSATASVTHNNFTGDPDHVTGTTTSEILVGTDDGMINGNGGNDVFLAGDGANVLIGGTGNDYFAAGDGNDNINGGGGNDYFVPGGGHDNINGGSGNDTYDIGLNDGTNNIYDGGGADRIYIRSHGSELTALNFSDLTPIPSSDLVMNIGNTSVSVGAHFHASGAYAVETLTFVGGATFRGYDLGEDAYYLVPADAVWWRSGTGGADILAGDSQDNIMDGGGGNDLLFGNFGNDMLYGGSGNDLLDGAWGNDILTGGEGDDVLIGGDGTDSLTGGNGFDTLWGGSGADTFVLDSLDASDLIADFETGSGGDIIDLSDLLDGFAGDKESAVKLVYMDGSEQLLSETDTPPAQDGNVSVEVDTGGGWTKVAVIEDTGGNLTDSLDVIRILLDDTTGPEDYGI